MQYKALKVKKMALVFLISVLFIIFLLSYYLFNEDIFSPTVLLSGSYLISAICCLYNIKTWGVNLHIYTVILILLGIVFFAIGEFFVKYVKLPHLKVKKCLSDEQNKYEFTSNVITVKKYKIVIVVLINIIITYLLYKEIIRIAYINYQDWGNLIYNYKTNAHNDSLNNSSLSIMFTQMLKITKSFGYIFLYVFINNMYYSLGGRLYKLRKNFIYLLPALFLSIQSLLKGVRIAIIALIIGGVFMAYFLAQNKKGWSFKFKIKHLIYSIVSISIILITFYQVKELFGRQQEDLGVVGYATTYLGASIQLFDQYMYDGSDTSINTIETFSGLISSLKKVGLFTNYMVLEQPEFRYSPTGLSIGNVYGGVRSYYNDFGILGVCVGFFIMSVILNVWYSKLKKRTFIKSNRILSFILYSSLVYGIVFLTFYDYLTPKIAIGFIAEIIILWICIKLVFSFKIKLKR